ncbi:hypothetical protein CCACVL1_15009 [Corchorus capsularis]|uniref:Uncharacterized protein n=1 Tax=Corchorus capsularis TaxID=210143 RepID=A0A1R3I4D3_COCAP|nr:hypothetical protein CCACVL1_15009 [Corchorus capsularis]
MASNATLHLNLNATTEAYIPVLLAELPPRVLISRRE